MNSAETHVSCLTPAGSAAIATVALRGPDAWNLVQPLFEPRSPPGVSSLPMLGRFGADMQDDVVVTVHGPEADQVVEIHCHGGQAVVRWITSLLVEHGAVEIPWQTWLQQALTSFIRGHAAVALAHAPTVRTAAILLDQYHGALDRAMQQLDDKLASGDVPGAVTLVEELLRWEDVGRHLTQPWRVVLAGAPNVGKSSLANAVLGYQRAVVSPVPGTTRDVVTSITAVNGWPVELCDTAGIRENAETLERQGVERARLTIAVADVCIWVLDGSREPVFPGPEIRTKLIRVINKSDLPAAWDHSQVLNAGGILVSAMSGDGVRELLECLAAVLVPEPPPSGAATPFTGNLCRRLHAIKDALGQNRLEQALELLND